MRVRAGVVLIQDGKVALIERHRAGLNYYVFPGGGVDEGETPEEAAVRESMEELGVEVSIQMKIAEIQHGPRSRQIYYLVEQTGGIFGTGTGEEFTDSDPNDPDEGIYIPVWMPIHELVLRDKVYPAEVAQKVVRSLTEGWLEVTSVSYEELK